MTQQEAEQMLGIIVGATSGWRDAPDETFQFYTRALSALRDVDVARVAVDELCATWSEARRPPVAQINAAYSTVFRREQMSRPQLPAPTAHVCTIDEGRRIAAHAYAQECERRRDDDPLVLSGFRKQEPSPKHLSALLGTPGEADL